MTAGKCLSWNCSSTILLEWLSKGFVYRLTLLRLSSSSPHPSVLKKNGRKRKQECMRNIFVWPPECNLCTCPDKRLGRISSEMSTEVCEWALKLRDNSNEWWKHFQAIQARRQSELEGIEPEKRNEREEDMRRARRMGGWGRNDDGGDTAGEEKVVEPTHRKGKGEIKREWRREDKRDRITTRRTLSNIYRKCETTEWT